MHFVANCNIFEAKEVFRRFVAAVNEGDVAIFYFTGHGCTFRNLQRLVCRGLTIGERMEYEILTQSIKDRSLRLEVMIMAVQEKKTNMNLFFLDCAREFSYNDKSVSGGVFNGSYVKTVFDLATAKSNLKEPSFGVFRNDSVFNTFGHARGTIISHATQINDRNYGSGDGHGSDACSP